MRRLVGLAVLLAALSACCSTAFCARAAVLKPGSYRLSWDKDLLCPCRAYADTTRSAPPGVAMPPFISKKPLYARMPFDNDQILVALDESLGTGEGYDIAYVDINRNQSLADDPGQPFDEDKEHNVVTGWITARAHQGLGESAEANPVKLRLYMVLYHSSEIRLSWQTMGGWRGRIGTSQGQTEIALADWNSNGTYGDLFDYSAKEAVQGDFIDIGSGPTPYRLRPTRLALFGGRFYHFASNDIGNRVTVSPYAGSLGRLSIKLGTIDGLSSSVKGSLQSAVITAADGTSYGLDSASGGFVEVPVGRYQLASCVLQVRAGKLPASLLRCQFSPEPSIEVKAEGDHQFSIAGRLTATIEPDIAELKRAAGASWFFKWVVKIGDSALVTNLGSAPIHVQWFGRSGELITTQTAGST